MRTSTSRRLRVVTFVTGLARGGAENALLELLDATRKEFEHSVVSLVAGGALAADLRARGIPVVEIGLRGWSVPVRSLLRMRQYIQEARADIVTAHMYHAIIAATFAWRIAAPRRALFWTVHHSLGDLGSEGWSTRLALRVCRRLSRAPNAIVYVSRIVAEHHTTYRFHADKGVLIPNGCDFERFQFDNEGRRRLRAEWGFADDDIVVGHIARVHPIKDHANMIAALRLATAQEPRLRAVICGHGTDRLVIPDEVVPNVRLLGVRTDVPQVISACDIGCLSSSAEAFGKVLAEFIACGRPCVSTDVGAAAELVRPYGRIVPTRDPVSLADALLRLSAAGEATRIALGKAGRAAIAQRLDIRSTAERHAALWREAIDKPQQ